MPKDYSIIVPFRDLNDQEVVSALLLAISKQSHLPKEVHFVVGDHRQGRAINYGVSQCHTTYVGTLDDDSVVDDPDLFGKIITAMEEDSTIGMGGAACEIPDFASDFQKNAMRQIPRRFFPTQSISVDSDMVQHPCLVMKREDFERIGGEDEELIRGLDPVLRKKVRDIDKRVTVIANTWVYHLLPDSFKALIKMYYRNGRGSGFAQRHFAGRVLELSDGYDQGEFQEKRSFVFRAFRRFFSLFHSIFSGKWIVVSTDMAYGFGVLKEKWFPSDQSPKAAKVVAVKSEKRPEKGFELVIHQVQLEGP